MEFFYVLIAAIFSNNYILSQLLGIYPAVNKQDKTNRYIVYEGILVTVAAIVLSLLGYALYTWVLEPLEISYIATIVMTLILWVIVQIIVLISNQMGKYNNIEITVEDIIANSIILAVILFGIGQDYTILDMIGRALGAGAGYTLISILLSDVITMVDEDLVVPAFRGVPLKLISLGLMAYVFWGFCCLLP